jgi:hypothetical protein
MLAPQIKLFYIPAAVAVEKIDLYINNEITSFLKRGAIQVMERFQIRLERIEKNCYQLTYYTHAPFQADPGYDFGEAKGADKGMGVSPVAAGGKKSPGRS